jgi:hypothetical protein
MNPTQSRKHDLETITWGALFIWWGIVELIPSLPAGTGALGIGLILLGLNAARARSGIPANSFSTTLGILAIVFGGLGLAGAVLNLPFELPTFAILLVVLGVVFLAREWIGSKNQAVGDMQ